MGLYFQQRPNIPQGSKAVITLFLPPLPITISLVPPYATIPCGRDIPTGVSPGRGASSPSWCLISPETILGLSELQKKSLFFWHRELLEGCRPCPAGLNPARSPNGFPWPGEESPSKGRSRPAACSRRGGSLSGFAPRQVTLAGTARPQPLHAWELLSRMPGLWQPTCCPGWRGQGPQ